MPPLENTRSRFTPDRAGKMDPHEMFQAVLKGTAKNAQKEKPYPKEYETADTSKKEVVITAESNELLIAL